ncbi:frequency clock protein [Fusarium oxysporum]|nr:frequency clock protein [Fusarium oxysporum]
MPKVPYFLKTLLPPTDYFLYLDSFSGSYKIVLSNPPEWYNDLSLNATANNNPADTNLSSSWEESNLLDIEKLYLHTWHYIDPPRPITAHSSSSNNYRSKELKRYKQPGPALLYKDKLFKIKLETILRDLAADYDGSPEALLLQKKKRISPYNRNYIYSKAGIQRSYTPSIGSSLRPANSAYASMSASGKSSRTPFYLPILPLTKSLKGKVKDYLRDVPDGLYL